MKIFGMNFYSSQFIFCQSPKYSKMVISHIEFLYLVSRTGHKKIFFYVFLLVLCSGFRFSLENWKKSGILKYFSRVLKSLEKGGFLADTLENLLKIRIFALDILHLCLTCECRLSEYLKKSGTFRTQFYKAYKIWFFTKILNLFIIKGSYRSGR